jgi:Protein of unknown function (DUF2690)
MLWKARTIKAGPWKLRRWLVIASLLAGMAVSVTGLSATPASAWAGRCGGGGCYGADPVVTGCSADAYTAASRSYYSTSQGRWITIQLRYSPSCQANWAKIIPAPAGWRFYVQDGWGNRVYETVGYNSSYWYGNMVDGARVSYACFLNGVCAAG